MNESDKTLFFTEWNHYMMGDMELDVKGFSLYFDKYVKKILFIIKINFNNENN